MAGYSETLVVITFTLTMWPIIKALRDYRFLLLAGDDLEWALFLAARSG